jgi:hypothetical protein
VTPNGIEPATGRWKRLLCRIYGHSPQFVTWTGMEREESSCRYCGVHITRELTPLERDGMQLRLGRPKDVARLETALKTIVRTSKIGGAVEIARAALASGEEKR